MGRYSTVAVVGAVFSALASLVVASSGCQVVNGNTFCKEVKQMMYENIVAESLSYQDVVEMDSNGCKCEKQPKTYSGSLAPLDEQV